MAWATPNHPVACGDVILAEPGTYSGGQFGANNWGQVSACPSTTGGVDGKGGIYFATVLCAGPDLESCKIDGGSAEAVRVDQSNWAVEGFRGTQTQMGGDGCFMATSESTAQLHHIAFINDMAVHCSVEGFGSFSWHSTGGWVDQTAIVGAIAFDTSPSLGTNICGSGISLIPGNGPDTSPGTHVFVAGAFSYRNINAPSGAGCNTDGEGLIFDSWGNDSYKYQAAVEQSVFWGNGSAAFEAFPQGNHTTDDAANVIVTGITAYGNHQDPKQGGGGELLLNGVYPAQGVSSYTFTDNIFEATNAVNGGTGTGKVLGATISCFDDCTKTISATGNFIWNSHAPTTTSPGGANTDVYYAGMDQGAAWPFGSDTFGDPGLADPSALPTAAPTCTGYASTTACMNEGYKVAASVKPSGAAAGKGYAAPGACKVDPYYPSWLKGVVYLSWDGSSLTENPGLINKPCDL